MIAHLTKILLYVKDIEATAEFYSCYFDFTIQREEGDRIVELVSPHGSMSLMLHQASKGKKLGQTCVKLVFDVEDVPGFCARCRERGLEFGSLYRGDGYVFANAKDPSNNSISVSSRAFRSQA